jgi:hypothetical protein
MAKPVVNTSSVAEQISKLEKIRLEEIKDELENFADADGDMTADQLSALVKELIDNMTVFGKTSGPGSTIISLYDTLEGKSGSLSKPEGSHKPSTRRSLQPIASAVIGAISDIIRTIKGGGRRYRSRINRTASRVPSVRINRTAGRRGKSRRRGNTRRRRH